VKFNVKSSKFKVTIYANTGRNVAVHNSRNADADKWGQRVLIRVRPRPCPVTLNLNNYGELALQKSNDPPNAYAPAGRLFQFIHLEIHELNCSFTTASRAVSGRAKVKLLP